MQMDPGKRPRAALFWGTGPGTAGSQRQGGAAAGRRATSWCLYSPPAHTCNGVSSPSLTQTFPPSALNANVSLSCFSN